MRDRRFGCGIRPARWWLRGEEIFIDALNLLAQNGITGWKASARLLR